MHEGMEHEARAGLAENLDTSLTSAKNGLPWE